MNLEQFKNRELDKCMVVIYVIKTEIQVEIEGRLKNRNMHLFVGINSLGKRRYLTYGLDYKEDSEFWIQRFRNIERRGVEKVIYIWKMRKEKEQLK